MTNQKIQGGVIDSINARYKGLRDVVNHITSTKSSKRIPTSIQLKTKTANMLQEILSGSTKLFMAELSVDASKGFFELGDERAKQLYHGFIVGNEDDRKVLFQDNPPAYIAFPDGKLPLEESVLLFLLLLAISDSPIHICTRVTLPQVKRWVDDYVTSLAYKLKFVMYKDISKKTQIDIT